ncbi:MAG: response regulator transcription factor [Clostridia bacterium]|nr:response regulator transcription factor [Clostridia bacterium]
MIFNILLIDDSYTANTLRPYLHGDKYHLFTPSTVKVALDILRKERVDLVLMNTALKNTDGIALTKKIRERSNVPIIMLSSSRLENDKLLGLKIGADDFVTKPFKPAELEARIHAQLRRYYFYGAARNQTLGDGEKLTLGELSIYTHLITLEKNGKPIPLTATEYKILVMLMKYPARIFTKAEIYEELTGGYFSSDDNTVMVHISNLRDKIEDNPKKPKYIKTVRGVGYKIEKL